MSQQMLSLFPARIPIGYVTDGAGKRVPVTLSPEFYRALRELLVRAGGSSSEVPDIDQLLMDSITAPVGGVDLNDAIGFVTDVPFTGVAHDHEMGDSPMVLQPAMTDPPQRIDPDPAELLATPTSPFSYTADFRCAININGSITWQSLEVSRSGLSWPVAGNTIELSPGDMLAFEFSGTAPDLTLIPR